MNEADPSPINLDELRMLPDWLREDSPPPAKQYAAHQYPTGDDSRDRRGGRQGGFGGGGDRRDSRGGGGPDRRREGGGRSGPPPRGGGGNRGLRDDRRPPAPAPVAPPMLAPVRVEFVPDDRCLASINKQIRSTHLAYPLFGLARMFLQEPERHFVQFTLSPEAGAGTSLYQLGEEGPVTLDRSILEKLAFESSKDQFYTELTVQKEPLKGNFTNVARERLSGVLLGPTNYHAYQPALRALYETRYSRRMSFEDFRRNVEVSTDPALVEKWKEEARTTTTIATQVSEGETPVTLNSDAEARAHFRQHHLDALLRSGTTFKLHGSVARKLPEPGMMQALREAHEREMRYPAQFVQLLRQGLQNAGLHIFKHHKRVVYVSLARPTPFVARGAVSPNLAAILETVAQSPLCTRKALAERVLSKHAQQKEAAPVEQKEQVALATENESAPPVRETVETLTAEPSANPVEGSATDTSLAASSPINNTAEPVVEPPPAPAAVLEIAAVATEDPAAKAKAALAADLRFLVQAGHIIEFHNGTFDLPLPPKAKEDSPTPNSKAAANQRPAGPKADAAPAPTTETAPPTDESQEEATEFVAAGAGVTEALEETEQATEVAAPSLLEVIEPAPSADNLETSSAELEEMVIEPGPAVPGDVGEQIHDKADDDGRISGAGAAPLDAPVPGDRDDPSDLRS